MVVEFVNVGVIILADSRLRGALVNGISIVILLQLEIDMKTRKISPSKLNRE